MARALGGRSRRLREGAFGVPQIVEDDLPNTGNVPFGNRFALWIHFRRYHVTDRYQERDGSLGQRRPVRNRINSTRRTMPKPPLG